MEERIDTTRHQPTFQQGQKEKHEQRHNTENKNQPKVQRKWGAKVRNTCQWWAASCHSSMRPATAELHANEPLSVKTSSRMPKSVCNMCCILDAPLKPISPNTNMQNAATYLLHCMSSSWRNFLFFWMLLGQVLTGVSPCNWLSAMRLWPDAGFVASNRIVVLRKTRWAKQQNRAELKTESKDNMKPHRQNWEHACRLTRCIYYDPCPWWEFRCSV